MIGMINNLRCKLFKIVGAYDAPDADVQFNKWMDEMTKEYDVTIYQIDSTQSIYGCHMIFVYYVLMHKVTDQKLLQVNLASAT